MVSPQFCFFPDNARQLAMDGHTVALLRSEASAALEQELQAAWMSDAGQESRYLRRITLIPNLPAQESEVGGLIFGTIDAAVLSPYQDEGYGLQLHLSFTSDAGEQHTGSLWISGESGMRELYLLTLRVMGEEWLMLGADIALLRGRRVSYERLDILGGDDVNVASVSHAGEGE